jgi:LmbE family N-acetylglucosaminyl deacetylase
MDKPTRRIFLKDLGAATAGLSVASEGAQASQLPGRAPSEDAPSSASATSNIMAIAAHPGDAFFTMSAAVALQVHLGARGVFVSLSLGEKGSTKIAPAQYGSLQRQAAERAARQLGAQSVILDYRDGEIPVSDEAKFAVCDLIREYKPDVLVTHWRGSWHKDHQACNAIVNDAVFYAGLPALARKQSVHSVRRLYFADNWEDAEGFTPDSYLDITPVFAPWSDACAAFPMWRGETGFRYNDYYGSLAVSRGCLSGSKYAVALMSPPDQLTRRLHAL